MKSGKKWREKSEAKGRKRKKKVTETGENWEFGQVILICRYIKKWEDLFRNIDFHTAGMKKDIGHRLQCVSTQLSTVTTEIASNTWTGNQMMPKLRTPDVRRVRRCVNVQPLNRQGRTSQSSLQPCERASVCVCVHG